MEIASRRAGSESGAPGAVPGCAPFQPTGIADVAIVPSIGYLPRVQSIGEQLGALSALQNVTVPDLWQQEAVSALRAGRDVVVQAPTGAGKTLIFELWSNLGKPRGQAIYTVPTRALANDKLAEWRARGWNVGIATGDLSENLSAPIVVATLETQKNRLIAGDGPALLVVDEYQMLADADRGLNYELAIALAPVRTQLLLLSGSVANPQDIVKWLARLGREAVLIRHDVRPVPLEEVHAESLGFHLPGAIRGHWPRLVAKALADNLGPILIFAPRRQAAESLAADLARQLPNPNPLALSAAQKLLVGEALSRMLKCRVAYHHSGLSYAARAGVLEPLAKAGQLRAVVATMGLAAGINFSLRSVAMAAESYRRDNIEIPLRPDEILQMFGRAGRRGIDEVGYVLVGGEGIRLREGYPAHLARSGLVDWSALLGIMAGAADQGRDPFTEAVKVQQRLFTTKPIFLGVEESMKHPETPCGLKTDSDRARHVRKRLREMLNSRGQWERVPALAERPLGEVFVPSSGFRVPGLPERRQLDNSELGTRNPELIPALSVPEALEKTGHGTLEVIGVENGQQTFGRALTVAELLNEDRVLLAKWIRRLTSWNGRQAPLALWNEKIKPLVAKKLALQKTPVARFEQRGQKILALVSLAELPARAMVDAHGVALWKPVEREVFPEDCARCSLVPICRNLPAATGTASLWRRLGLIDERGVPTLRGRIVSFFHQEDGLAIAASLEDESFPLDELVYELANLDAGFRFCGEENRWAGRIPIACHQLFGLQTVPGYLENGVPPRYGSGAELVVAGIHKDPLSKSAWITELLGTGDIDRVIIEWRSLLRQLSKAPTLDWPRWTALQSMARGILNETESPTLIDLPPLDYAQTRRIEHQLTFRRH
ncbi:MAG TPA: DEAD/DEAH box helicase [Verrucomicrobiae bacterium]|nr:DEAD/DEAH box helicase [Verrucomicrobiae bacterium]